MGFVRPGDLQVAANSKRLRSNDIPKPSPWVITPPSSASQDAPPSSPTHDATSHRLTKKGRPKRSQPPHFQFQPQHQHQHQPSPPPSQHQPSPTQPQPQHQPSPPPSPPQHQLPTTPPQQQFPPEVTKDHWAMYLNYRLSPDTMAKADKNALNRQKQRIPHTLGTRSLARTKDIMEQRDGRSYNRGDMYEISHTKRNGSYVNDEARQKNEELQKERQTSSDNEAFVTVFGKERHGYVRGMGLGPTPSQINGSSCRPSGSTFSSTADAKIAKMQSEIDVLTKEVTEVNELKAKIAEFDAMKEQFALIMANMQNHGSNIGSPFEVRRSSESSHNVEGDQATPDD
ncbi:hypothetical protein P8452_27303 [Trifolium repens]|nr:hypothetical protein P8452_27303 [Trifolium repens]